MNVIIVTSAPVIIIVAIQLKVLILWLREKASKYVGCLHVSIARNSGKAGQNDTWIDVVFIQQAKKAQEKALKWVGSLRIHCKEHLEGGWFEIQ